MGIALKQWTESWPDNFDEETNELISEGGLAFCGRFLFLPKEKEILELKGGTINHGKHPKTGEWDSQFDTYNYIMKTLDVVEFENWGGSRPLALGQTVN